MAIETPTAAQRDAAQQNLDICKQSLAQQAEQLAVDAVKKAKEQVDIAQQQLARMPEEIISGLQDAIAELLKIINGWENPSEPEFDADAIIGQIQALLDPVVNTLLGLLKTVGIPSIQGLDKIVDLLAALGKMKPSENPKPGKIPDIPPDLMSTLTDLLAAIQSLCMTLPAVLVNVIFKMIDKIVNVKIPVANVTLLGLAGSPVSLIGDFVGLAPKITDLVINMPGKIKIATERKIRDQIKAIQDLSIPDAPDDIQTPNDLPPCPQR